HRRGPPHAGGLFAFLEVTMNCFFDVITEDKHGALLRIVGVFASLGVNIEQLSAHPSDRTGLTDVKVRLKGDEGMLRTVSRKLRRIVTVVEVSGRLEAPEENSSRTATGSFTFEEAPAATF
ncbi:MAG: ACT domain-containing protein, partial [Acidobacteria bacterium]|nr:ACT domain-containing protein [Acidobacteriota bacterium]